MSKTVSYEDNLTSKSDKEITGELVNYENESYWRPWRVKWKVKSV